MTYDYVCKDRQFGIIDLRTEEVPNSVKNGSKIYTVLKTIMLVCAVIEGGFLLLFGIFEQDFSAAVVGIIVGGLLYGFSRLFDWLDKRMVNQYRAKREEIAKKIECGEIDIYTV